MATLKEHQAAMVDLLANGSGIPASASRLAHAMHDVLEIVANSDLMQFVQKEQIRIREHNDATTPGLNDKALSKRVKELENTIRQLKANNAKLRADKCEPEDQVEAYRRMAIPEQAGCRKEDTQVCFHIPKVITPGTDGFPDGYLFCEKCGQNLAKDFRTKEAEAIALGKELGGYL